jgi:pimeloyl-ACP methyl ester carboxylesterase
MSSKERRRIGRVIRGGVYYLVVMTLLYGCSDRLILFPSRDPIATQGQTRLMVPGLAGQLEVFSMQAPAVKQTEPHAFVLHFIGNASRAEYEGPMVQEQWVDKGVEIWTVNYPGYGASQGSAKLASMAPGGLAAYDALAKVAGARPIFVSGNSIGTTVALYVAAHRPVAGLALHNPPPLRQLILGRHGWWNLWLAAGPVALSIPSDLDSLSNAQKVKAPAVFLSSEDDEVVPAIYHQKVIDAYAGPKKVIRLGGSSHNAALSHASLAELRKDIGWLLEEP